MCDIIVLMFILFGLKGNIVYAIVKKRGTIWRIRFWAGNMDPFNNYGNRIWRMGIATAGTVDASGVCVVLCEGINDLLF